MSSDWDAPAENPEYASSGHHADERVDPGTFAYQLFEHLADVHGDADADLYASRVVAELFELSPIARQHISDLFFVELTEELHRRGQRDAAKAVLEVQTLWEQEA